MVIPHPKAFRVVLRSLTFDSSVLCAEIPHQFRSNYYPVRWFYGFASTLRIRMLHGSVEVNRSESRLDAQPLLVEQESRRDN